MSLRDVFRWHGSKIHEEADIKIRGISRKVTLLKMYSIWFSCISWYVLTEFARLDRVIISLVICLTSVSGPSNMGTLVHPHRE